MRLGARLPPLGLEIASRLLHVGFVVDETGLDRFFSEFLPFSPTTNFIPLFIHDHLIHFLFHFINLYDGAAGVVGWHLCMHVCMYVCMYVYLGLRARQHLRSLAPVMK